jgi:hypothetical protein
MRINLEVTSSVWDLLQSLQDRTGGSKKGVIVGALLFLKWSLDQQDEGRRIVAVDEDGDNTTQYHSELLYHAGLT